MQTTILQEVLLGTGIKHAPVLHFARNTILGMEVEAWVCKKTDALIKVNNAYVFEESGEVYTIIFGYSDILITKGKFN